MDNMMAMTMTIQIPQAKFFAVHSLAPPILIGQADDSGRLCTMFSNQICCKHDDSHV